MQLFASPATWALFMAHATYNFVRYTIEQEMLVPELMVQADAHGPAIGVVARWTGDARTI